MADPADRMAAFFCVGRAVVLAEKDFAVGGVVQAGQNIAQACVAGAIIAHDCGEAPGFQAQRDAVQGKGAPVNSGDRFEANLGHAAASGVDDGAMAASISAILRITRAMRPRKSRDSRSYSRSPTSPSS